MIKDNNNFDYLLYEGLTTNTLLNHTYDFVYLDGGHSYDTVKHDYNKIKNSKVIVFDDAVNKNNANDVNKFLKLFEKNVSNFDWTSFSNKLSDEFFSGNIQDAEISEEKMRSFLDKNYNTIEVFADDHINKIKWLNEQYKK